MTKHIIIQEDDINIFKSKLDKANKDNNVFATQTHLTPIRILSVSGLDIKPTEVSERLKYTAILFCKD